jgi:hypothetical protein
LKGPILRWAGIVLLVALTALAIPLLWPKDVRNVSAAGALQKVNDRFTLPAGDSEVVYTRFMVTVKGRVYDYRIQGFHDRHYLAELWTTGDGNSFRYQLTGPETGAIYYFLQREGDLVRRSSSADRFGFDPVSEVVEIPFDVFLEQVQSRLENQRTPAFLATGSVIDSLFNLNQLASATRKVCLDLVCLLELDRANVDLEVRLLENTAESVIGSPAMLEITGKFLDWQYPYASLSFDPSTYELQTIEAGWVTNLQGQKEYDAYSSAVLEEHRVLVPAQVPPGLFHQVPEGIDVIPITQAANSGEDVSDRVWIFSTSLPPGSVLGHEEYIWFEADIGYELQTVPEASMRVSLARKDQEDLFKSLREQCIYGIPGTWLGAGISRAYTLSSGGGTVHVQFMIVQKDLIELGPTDVVLSIQILEEVGDRISMPLWDETYPEFTYTVDVPPVQVRECPIPEGIDLMEGNDP